MNSSKCNLWLSSDAVGAEACGMNEQCGMEITRAHIAVGGLLHHN